MSRSAGRRAMAAAIVTVAVLGIAPASFAKAPPAPAEGTLSVASTYLLPHVVTARYNAPLITEAPDGVIFFASGMTVFRTANQATRAAVKIGDRIFALAATSDLLAVETPTDVFVYSRVTGKRVADWDVEETGTYPPALVFSGDVLWSLTDQATDASGLEPATLEELRVGHPARIVTDQAGPATPVVDGAGDVYYVKFGGSIARVTPSGASRKSADPSYAAAELAYVNDMLVAEIETASPVVEELDPTTLKVIRSHRGQAGDFYGLAGTSVGALSLSNSCTSTLRCKDTHVRRITLPDTRGPALAVPYGALVMGPNPTVLEQPARGKSQLVGLRLA